MSIVITGAASGIGRAVAQLGALGGRYGEMLLVDINSQGLDETAALVSKAGVNAKVLALDLAKPDSAFAAIDLAHREFGRIDSVISNAGILRSASLKDLDVETFDLMFDINTRPTWLLGKAAHGHLSASGGSIVATASISGEQPTPNLANYSASKAALIMLVKQMALEWGPDGIRCNCVSPGPTFTGLTAKAFNDANDPTHAENRRRREAALPLRKIGTPEEVASLILFLAGAEASQITGVNVNVDGGQTLALMPATGGGSGHAK
ncbi:MAG: SDR family oxidoreductase [Mesorhizobium sp.]|nr:SDR family oxidoreductase [Mesorhizobium sp.]